MSNGLDGEIRFGGAKPRFFNAKKDQTAGGETANGFQKSAAMGSRSIPETNGATKYVQKQGLDASNQNTLNAAAKPFVARSIPGKSQHFKFR